MDRILEELSCSPIAGSEVEVTSQATAEAEHDDADCEYDDGDISYDDCSGLDYD